MRIGAGLFTIYCECPLVRISNGGFTNYPSSGILENHHQNYRSDAVHYTPAMHVQKGMNK